MVCAEGYVIGRQDTEANEHKLKCVQLDGGSAAWMQTGATSESPPTCKRIKCNKRSKPTGAKSVLTADGKDCTAGKIEYGAVCTMKCRAGKEVVGKDAITCETNRSNAYYVAGTWSGKLGSCE